MTTPEKRDDLVERLQSHMGKQDVGILLSDCRQAADEITRLRKELAGKPLWPGLDHIANFINSLDSSEMSAKDVRSAIYSECLEPTLPEAPHD